MIVTALILNTVGFISLIASTVYRRKARNAGEIAPPLLAKTFVFYEIAFLLYLSGYMLVAFFG